MTLLNVLFNLIVEPIKLFFEVVFFYAYKASNNVGLSIFLLSLFVNFLVLPFYMQADKLQKEERDIQDRMADRIKQIKKTFKGDERFFMLQEYYRVYNYKPVYALKSSVSLFLQIPFFIAAYSFLTELKLMQGASIGPITNLSMPDALIHFGTISINVLPILMTVINIIASLIYSEKSPIKDKLKLLVIALVFLVLLYNSPAGLVFYWTLNNLFSLIKNIVLHFKKPSSKISTQTPVKNIRNNMELIYISCSIMALITGLVTPAGITFQNPEEITNTFIESPHSPILYLVNSLLIAIGTFMIWIPIFVYLVKGYNFRKISYAFVAFSIVGIVNTLLFNAKLGLLTSRLIYEKNMSFQLKDIIINIVVDIIIFVTVYFLGLKLTRYIKLLVAIILVSSIISGSCLGVLSLVNSDTEFNINPNEEIIIPLTTNGKNVVVIMMDRMIGSYIPYIFTENPELASQFDGFTYYPNTVSFGAHTNIAAPALYGGYEYTPERMNMRSDELLVDKHNESLRVLPTLFANEGWNVVVGDAPYANYKWYTDTSIYDDNEKIQAYNISFSIKNDLTDEVGIDMEERLNRNFFCYGLMRTLPYLIQPYVYSEGTYNYFFNESFLSGPTGTYIREELALESLSHYTQINDSPKNCFLMYTNGLTHCDFSGSVSDEIEEYTRVVNNVPMYLDDDEDYRHYLTNIKACFLLGKWFDYLKENNVYDNTRIIIVSDHGYGLNNFDDLLVKDLALDAEWFNPVFMVKDFDQTGFSVSDDFMTNANTPYFAVNGIIDNPVNPFTNVPIVRNSDNEEQLIYTSHQFSVVLNNGTTYKDPNGQWLTVHGNIWDDDNWSVYDN